MVKDRYNENEISSIKLKLIGQRPIDNNQYELPTSTSTDIESLIGKDNSEPIDNNQYELPTSTDIESLIGKDNIEYKERMDIVVKDKTNSLQIIIKLHSSYMTFNIHSYLHIEKMVI
ncbi:hypothetical protein PanWU01x14_300370 [Parasponia andersonii]|uniref:Uncharacterized protein n=1 Tax=Parasponia andersonii TaxID=3476 RepID=A0A2P5ATY8_PARAD|nr:hypothetical protein PanWU01x14_300370 [Parasponia andersonii]